MFPNNRNLELPSDCSWTRSSSGISSRNTYHHHASGLSGQYLLSVPPPKICSTCGSLENDDVKLPLVGGNGNQYCSPHSSWCDEQRELARQYNDTNTDPEPDAVDPFQLSPYQAIQEEPSPLAFNAYNSISPTALTMRPPSPPLLPSSRRKTLLIALRQSQTNKYRGVSYWEKGIYMLRRAGFKSIQHINDRRSKDFSSKAILRELEDFTRPKERKGCAPGDVLLIYIQGKSDNSNNLLLTHDQSPISFNDLANALTLSDCKGIQLILFFNFAVPASLLQALSTTHSLEVSTWGTSTRIEYLGPTKGTMSPGINASGRNSDLSCDHFERSAQHLADRGNAIFVFCPEVLLDCMEMSPAWATDNIEANFLRAFLGLVNALEPERASKTPMTVIEAFGRFHAGFLARQELAVETPMKGPTSYSQRTTGLVPVLAFSQHTPPWSTAFLSHRFIECDHASNYVLPTPADVVPDL